MNLPDLPTFVDHFRKRVLQDALQEATASYWLRRARVFEAVGTEACDEIARACRNKAALVPLAPADFQAEFDAEGVQ